MTMPRLPPQGFPGPQIQVVNYQENLATLAMGNKSYTGIGFKPRTLEISARLVTLGQIGSWGFSDPDKHIYCSTLFQFNLASSTQNALVFIYGSGAWIVWANVASYDSDGFTLTWALIGAGPTGLLDLIVRAMS
jgi:hypothetical protein